jgi:hypothetical protein
MRTVLVIAICLQLGFYTILAAILLLRRHRKEISSRSPWLLTCSHAGNAIQGASFLVQILGTSYQKQAVAIPQIFSHFLFYFPFILRGYRLYFVFYSDLGESNKGHNYFLRHLKRSRQVWLLGLLAVLMVPVVLLCAGLVMLNRWETNVYNEEEGPGLFALVYIAVTFAEQVVLVIGIYALRHVDRDYSMSRELVFICVLWYFNLLFSYHTNLWYWTCEVLARNTVIMCVSVLLPVIQSYKRPEMKETLTLQSLRALPVILENPLPHDYFQQFLRTRSPKTPLTVLDSELELAGDTVLDLYLRCQIYQDRPSLSAAEETIQELHNFSEEFSILPSELLQQINLRSQGPTSELLVPAENFLWELLETHYFPLFQQSVLFNSLCRFVEQSELRAGRVNSTSLGGDESP